MSACVCQDSNGLVCGKEMTKQEYQQDGVCSTCADHVWTEMGSTDDYFWKHKNTGISQCKK